MKNHFESTNGIFKNGDIISFLYKPYSSKEDITDVGLVIKREILIPEDQYLNPEFAEWSMEYYKEQFPTEARVTIQWKILGTKISYLPKTILNWGNFLVICPIQINSLKHINSFTELIEVLDGDYGVEKIQKTSFTWKNLKKIGCQLLSKPLDIGTTMANIIHEDGFCSDESLDLFEDCLREIRQRS